jgi:ornithine decarboxylase
VRLIRPRGPVSPTQEDFTVYGPTCDANDVLPFMWSLPPDVAEGDWIEVEQVGAYSNALANRFNGFYSDHFVTIG